MPDMLEDFPCSLLFCFFKWAFVREVNVLCYHICCIWILLFVLLKSVCLSD